MKKQLIDADALIKLMNEKHKHLVDENGWYDRYTSGYEDAITDVEEAPIVDAVPVVRCRDCRLWSPVGKRAGKCPFMIGKNLFAGDDHYCSLGEKEEDECD